MGDAPARTLTSVPESSDWDAGQVKKEVYDDLVEAVKKIVKDGPRLDFHNVTYEGSQYKLKLVRVGLFSEKQEKDCGNMWGYFGATVLIACIFIEFLAYLYPEAKEKYDYDSL